MAPPTPRSSLDESLLCQVAVFIWARATRVRDGLHRLPCLGCPPRRARRPHPFRALVSSRPSVVSARVRQRDRSVMLGPARQGHASRSAQPVEREVC